MWLYTEEEMHQLHANTVLSHRKDLISSGVSDQWGSWNQPSPKHQGSHICSPWIIPKVCLLTCLESEGIALFKELLKCSLLSSHNPPTQKTFLLFLFFVFLSFDARDQSNLGPHACKASILPLIYPPRPSIPFWHNSWTVMEILKSGDSTHSLIQNG